MMISPYYYQLLVIASINAIMALSLNLVTGCAGQLSLGHAAFMGIGAYTAGILTSVYDVPFAVSLIAGGAVAALAGLIVGLPTLRLKGDYLAIATLGFGEIIRVAILNMGITGGPFGLRGISKHTNLALAATAAVLVYWTMTRLMNSRFGRALTAIREDEVAAVAMGIDVTRCKVLAFVISAAWAGVAGGLFAHWFRYLHPSSFAFAASVEILSMVVLGGMGSLEGPVIGAVVLTYAPELLRGVSDFVSRHRMLFYGALLVIMMLVRPQGLVGAGVKGLRAARLSKFQGFGRLQSSKLGQWIAAAMEKVHWKGSTGSDDSCVVNEHVSGLAIGPGTGSTGTGVGRGGGEENAGS
ncbi:MAG: branched-chain amino acid ABC transporter permease [Bacillota bacterium]|jgi:branched-chain amino acid transport system permease protein